MKALVIHARRTGYGVVRSLDKLGAEIIIADEVSTPVFYSNKIDHKYIVPKLLENSNEQLLQKLIDIGETHAKGEKILVFSGNDGYLLFFAKHYKELSPYYIYSFEHDLRHLKGILSKCQLAKLARSVGVLIPKTVDSSAHEQEYSSLAFPLIIKPEFKRTMNEDIANKAFRLKVCNSTDELDKSRKILTGLGSRYVVQEYIPGDDSELFTVGVFAKQGNLLAYSMAQKIRQFPPHAGECSYGQLYFDNSLLETCRRLIYASSFSGICQIEFKRYGNEYYLIEINPRVWSWHEIHSIAGVNLIEICYKSMMEDKEDVYLALEVEGTWHFAMMDLLHNVLLSKKISFVSWIKAAWGADIHAFFSIKDPLPFLIYFNETIRYILKELRKRKV